MRPLRPVPLGVILLPALAVAALHRPGIPGALVYIVALFVVLRYGYMIIENRAWGHDRDAITEWAAFNRGFGMPLKQIAVVTVFALVHGVAVHYGGEAAGYAVLLAVNFAAPATVLIISLGGGLVDALDPVRIAGVVARVGFDYVTACFALALFSLTGNIVLDILLAAGHPGVRLFLYSACSFYYILAVFFMMAWLVERRREELIG